MIPRMNRLVWNARRGMPTPVYRHVWHRTLTIPTPPPERRIKGIPVQSLRMVWLLPGGLFGIPVRKFQHYSTSSLFGIPLQ